MFNVLPVQMGLTITAMFTTGYQTIQTPFQKAIATEERCNRTDVSKISGNASNQAEPMALLPCWVFACGYKMAQKSQEQSWPIKHH
jgi:hypothetical protein